MRNGFTTGSCAAAAAKASADMLFTDGDITTVTIMTPAGEKYNAQIIDIKRDGATVTSSVLKDGGDDPDVTTGVKISATVSLHDEPVINIDGGKGVGRVTKPGLDQPVGCAAINTVPRRMIEEAVRDTLRNYDYQRGADVIISVEDGEKLAERTFNPTLGIVGGISIIGTTGIVLPMSEAALKDTIRITIRQQVALGHKSVFAVPGNYGKDFARDILGADDDRTIKCSNFIGDTIDMAADEGVDEMLIVGHMGKMIKLCGGITNTHSKVADCRIELIASMAILSGADADTARIILSCVTTEEAFDTVKRADISESFIKLMMDRIDNTLKKRADGRIKIAAIVYLNNIGIVGTTDNADDILSEIRNEK